MKLEQDTLAMQMNRPMTQHLDKSMVPVDGLVTAMNDYMDNQSKYAVPEEEAINFYLTNHILSEVMASTGKHEPLGDKLILVMRYQEELSKSAVRMFYYLLLICTRESRHVYDDYDWSGAAKKHGDDPIQFTKSISHESSTGAVKRFRETTHLFILGRYTGHLLDLFNEGSFSGGYGGKAWGEVTQCLHNFVTGVYSAEMMMDTAFTLCHNNGPIFNKGMLFSSYDSYEIVKILDVQRAGQIPQLIDGNESPFINNTHRDFRLQAQAILGESVSGYVDWFMVEQLGAVQNYVSLQKEQVKKYGVPKNHADKLATIKKAQEIKQLQADLALNEENKTWFQVTPIEKVKKVKMIRA